MKKIAKYAVFLFILILSVSCAPSVSSVEEESGPLPIYGQELKDGSYEVEMESSSSMFRIVKAKLNVSDGNLTVDMTLSGTGYLKLFMGTGEEALESGEEDFIPFVEDDEGAYTYTIPVEAVNQEFDCAAFSKRKQQWYDRQLMILGESLPEEAKIKNASLSPAEMPEADGIYTMEVTLNGGTGRATVSSPAQITISEGKAIASVEWSSPDYDYMLVNGTQYLPVNEGGNSVFEIPILVLDEEMDVTADTVAMSKPHEIEYSLIFHSDTLQKTESENDYRDTNISSHLIYQKSMELQYADQFAVDYYEDGYVCVSVADGRRYLIIPENGKQPKDLETDIVVLKRPMEQIYLVATAVMDMFCELDALDAIRFSGQKADGWCRKEPQEEMERGNILYAGKYSAPDYERIVSEGCSLAIENNMISHSPEVMEKMEEFGIPVLIDLSSYEKHPLGRVEWVRLYGVLLGKEKEAKEIFEEQVRVLHEIVEEKSSKKSVAYFFITANGMVNVRASSDYIPKMLELAGGTYIFEDLGREDSNRSTVTMQMEEFYLAAKDADYLVYNSTIEGEITSIEELLEMESLLGDFKAVQEGNVWCTTRDLYQQSMSIGQMIRDFHYILSGESQQQEEVLYLYPLN